MKRYALISTQDIDLVRSYLPRNYSIMARSYEGVFIGGEDRSGWTLDGYVLPRLASGLIFGREITEEMR